MIHNDTVYCVIVYVSEVSKQTIRRSLLQKGLGEVMSAGVFLLGEGWGVGYTIRLVESKRPAP